MSALKQLNRYERWILDQAKAYGRLVILDSTPVETPLPAAWREWCEANGVECVIEDRSGRER